MKTVVRGWLSEYCTYKQQTVLLSALRGCDGIQKEDPSKQLVRGLRAEILHSANPGQSARSFMVPDDFSTAADMFLNSLDHYPVHWLFHFTHATEVIGYKHPNADVRNLWFTIYSAICKALHLYVESEGSLDERLKDNL